MPARSVHRVVSGAEVGHRVLHAERGRTARVGVIASIWARTVSVGLLGAHVLGSEILRAQVAHETDRAQIDATTDSAICARRSLAKPCHRTRNETDRAGALKRLRLDDVRDLPETPGPAGFGAGVRDIYPSVPPRQRGSCASRRPSSVALVPLQGRDLGDQVIRDRFGQWEPRRASTRTVWRQL